MMAEPSRNAPARRIRRRLIRYGIPLLAVSAALWWGPSAGLRYGLSRAIEAAGYRVVELTQARVSLVEWRVEVGGLRVAGPGEAQLEAAGIEISPGQLFRGRIDVPQLRLSGLTLDLVRSARGWRMSGFDLGATGSGGNSGYRPQLRVGRLELLASRLELRDGVARTEIAVTSARLEGIDTGNALAPVSFDIDGTVGTRRVRAKGGATPFAAVPELEAHLDVDGVELAPFARLVGAPLSGALHFAGDVKAGTSDGVSVAGTARLSAAAYEALRASVLSWQGDARIGSDNAVAAGGRFEIDRGTYAADAFKGTAERATFDGRMRLDAGGKGTLVGALALSALTIDASDRSVAVARARLETSGMTFGADVAAVGKASAALDGVDYGGAEGKGAVRSLSGTADFSVARRSTFGANFVLQDAAFETSDIRFSAPAASLRVSDARLIDGAAEGRVALGLDGAQAGTGTVALQGERIAFDGMIALRGDGTLGAEGAFDARALRADLREVDARASLATLTLAGKVASTAEGPTFDGGLRTGAVSVVDSTARELFAAAGIEAGSARFDTAGLTAGRIAVSEPRVLRREKATEGREAFGWRLRAARAEVGDVRVAPSGAAAIETVRIASPVLRVTRTKNGFLSFERGAPPPPGTQPPPVAPSPGFTLGRFEISDGRAVFEDRTPHDTVRIPVDRLSLSVRDIDIGRPERPTAVALSARVGSFGQANLRGTVYPFDARLSFDLDVAVRSIDLPPVSTYFDDLLGVDVRTGTASVEGKIVARQERLSGETKWRLSNVRIDDRETQGATLAEQAGVPVATILSLLSDDEGNIALDIPVSGELSNPDFDTGDAVRQAVGGAMRGALSNTFTLLFPFGTFVSAALDAERRGTGLTLPDVSFAPGDAALDTGAQTVVDGLAKLLSARPAARLEVCGFAGPTDAPAIPRRPGARPVDDDTLRRLAERRADAVKRRLVDERGIDAGRIFECRPVAEDESAAKPRAELRF